MEPPKPRVANRLVRGKPKPREANGKTRTVRSYLRRIFSIAFPLASSSINLSR